MFKCVIKADPKMLPIFLLRNKDYEIPRLLISMQEESDELYASKTQEHYSILINQSVKYPRIPSHLLVIVVDMEYIVPN